MSDHICAERNAVSSLRFLIFICVCLEPVLVNYRLMYKNLKEKGGVSRFPPVVRAVVRLPIAESSIFSIFARM